MTRPIPPATLHRIYGTEPIAWHDPRAYRPDPVEMLRANARKSPSIFATLVADFREFWAEVADAPAHHAVFGLLILVGVAVLFVAPIIVAGWVK